MVWEPQAGRRRVFVRKRRTRLDFAAVVKTLCDELYPQAEKIVLVMDQLNTHGVASLYEALAPAEARRLLQPSAATWKHLAKSLAQKMNLRNVQEVSKQIFLGIFLPV